MSRSTDETIKRIEVLLKDKTVAEIADELGMKYRTVQNLISDYALGAPRKRYRLPKFSGWDFACDNLNLPHGV